MTCTDESKRSHRGNQHGEHPRWHTGPSHDRIASHETASQASGSSDGRGHMTPQAESVLTSVGLVHGSDSATPSAGRGATAIVRSRGLIPTNHVAPMPAASSVGRPRPTVLPNSARAVAEVHPDETRVRWGDSTALDPEHCGGHGACPRVSPGRDGDFAPPIDYGTTRLRRAPRPHHDGGRGGRRSVGRQCALGERCARLRGGRVRRRRPTS